MASFEIRDLTFSYPDSRKNALKNVNITIEKGEFLTVCGPSGCGKSTLLRHLRSSVTPHGVRSGAVFFEGTALSGTDERTQAEKIGFVFQDPDAQIVTDKVWHELAFGAESLGYDSMTIRRRTAEMASFFGIEDKFHKNVNELSGGEKQLLDLAAVMVTGPSVVILDEPTSQLDPIAASVFINTLGRINRELGVTVIVADHRLEELFAIADRTVFMRDGRVVCSGTPSEVGIILSENNDPFFASMPAAMRIWAATCGAEVSDTRGICPVSVRDGRTFLEKYAETHDISELPEEKNRRHGSEVIHAAEVSFRYEKGGPDVVRSLSLSAGQGEILAVMGGNGAGKTTMIKLLAGILKPQRGEIYTGEKIGYLPQDPEALFACSSVSAELEDAVKTCKEKGRGKRGGEPAGEDERIKKVISLCRLEGLTDRHPFDLSGGEKQRAALAKVLLYEPELLLIDEPTKGLDAEYKNAFGKILEELSFEGKTVVMVSHDVEFCASFAHRVALFFDGSIIAEGSPRSFFSGSRFYTTAANRIAGELIPGAVTVEDVLEACGVHPEDIDDGIGAGGRSEKDDACLEPPDETRGKTGQGRGEFPETREKGEVAEITCRQSSDRPTVQGSYKARRTASSVISAAMVFLMIPLTLLIGSGATGGKKYYVISLLILFEIMIPVFILFEGRKPRAREIVLISVLCALGVAGRAAFFMLPGFKPVLALTIITGASLGAETGFLVGSLTMFISNIMFAQGPWTPWQMFAMGLAGFLAGLLFRRGALPKKKAPLCIFGALSAVIIYGGIMNPAAALIWAGSSDIMSAGVLTVYYVSGFPFDCIHGAATALFLFLISEPMLEKLDRVTLKYGMMKSPAR